MDKLYVNEIFESPQGEGHFTGRMAIFVRFAGCNLECEFCDTKYARRIQSGRLYTPKQLLTSLRSREYVAASQINPLDNKASRANPIKFIVLTGGEPMIQDLASLAEFVSLLKAAGYYVAMETNGTKTVNKLILAVDWVTVSPKTALFDIEGDELKLLYDGTQDLEFYEQFHFQYFYLQPILPERGLFITDLDTKIVLPLFEAAFKKVLRAVEERPIWRISFQTQKLAGFR